jgi:hypothetical protein
MGCDHSSASRDLFQENKNVVSMQIFEELLQAEVGRIEFTGPDMRLMDPISERICGQLNAISRE